MNKRVKGLLVFAAVAALAGLGYLQRWNIYDQWRLYNYTPPTAISQLATQTTMTAYAKRLFFSYHPVLEDSASFNKNCNVSKRAIVLGCTVNLRGIYIYETKDPQLEGILQVTAAHEMLHVAYSRLSSSEQQHIDKLVVDEFNRIKGGNPILVREIEGYRDSEGETAIPNELHSLLGTEVGQLPPELEQYYSRYFNNRQAIIKYKNQYQAAFSSRQAAIDHADQQLSATQKAIESNEAELKRQSQAISSQRTALDQKLANNDIAGYNAGVAPFNAAIANYNRLAEQTKQLINDYNQLLKERNALALQINQLTQTISSQPLGITPNTAAPQ